MMRSVATIAAILLVGCMSVPTLPVPPPVDMTKVFPLTEPNENGIVCVSAAAGFVVPASGDVHGIKIRVTNLDTLEWVEEYVNSDGSFNDVCIFAESGHTLAIQAVYPYGGVTEPEPLPVP
jgi:hypothetical protein